MPAILSMAVSTAAVAGKSGKSPPKPLPVETYAGRIEATVFAEEMAARGVDPKWVLETLSQARKLETVRRAAKPVPPGQRKNWRVYRDRYVEPIRTRTGREFLQKHAAALNQASQQFGVPVEVMLGILGVETNYGRDTGRYRVVDALATLAFDFPVAEGRDRSDYFREQLAQFFIWCDKELCEPLSVKGSHAGAIGMPQFMPENIHRFGSDFNRDGRIDLHDPVDAIGSVARFLALHGWVRQLVPAVSVELVNAQLEPLLTPDIVPTFTQPQLFYHGARPTSPLPVWEKFALVELQNGDAESEYVLGSRNFYVLTRYNRSSLYAMAVLMLGWNVLATDATLADSISTNGKTEIAASTSRETCTVC
ncbi:MAG: lytic murein transglycosylase B [Hydrogenophilaceae bacterium]|nr:lytic murein transglycosylase B [Hydrogenophilaceae bacterium]